ncbi:MAG TPA: thioredoxin family protein [Gemmatimonadales bacterium]|nr:thioredoxin family protein [Gemmatimonadales bacterium]
MSHPVVSPDQWQIARAAFLMKEKEFTKLRDELSRERRALPWEKVEKDYRFDGPSGPESLSDLFAGKSQLVVYHFMFNPADDVGCPHCSFWADHYDGMVPHLRQRDVSFVVISRAPRSKLAAFQQRMGWKFKWLSSGDNSFNYDYRASFTPDDARKPIYNFGTLVPGGPDREGLSVFTKDASGAIFRTYSTYARGIDMFNGTYQILDLVPKGRDEDPEATQDWVRHHDRYDP